MTMQSIVQFLKKLIEHWFLELILGIILLAVTAAARRFSLSVWAALSTVAERGGFRLRVWLNRFGIRVVTLDDYVALLESLRERLVRYCASHEALRIKICVLTMQLPRDWPLWSANATAAQPDKTALEQYFFNFDSFLQKTKKAKRDADVRRVIVIDNKDSPAGQERFKKLCEDVDTPLFDRYLHMLHIEESRACYYLHQRPWPGWLTDAVFYGFEGERGTHWLWAVTTSYGAGEDLLLLRFHRMRRRLISKRFALPWGTSSLIEFVDLLPSIEQPSLLSLRRDPNPGGAKPSESAVGAAGQRRNSASPSPKSRRRKG